MKVNAKKISFIEYWNLSGRIVQNGIPTKSRDAKKMKRKKNTMAFRFYDIAKGTVTSNGQTAKWKSEPFNHSLWHVYRGHVYKRGDKHLQPFKPDVESVYPKAKRFLVTPGKTVIPFRRKHCVLLAKKR